MMRTLLLAFCLLLPSVASAQQAIWIEFGPGVGLGILLTPDGKVTTFTELLVLKPSDQPPPISTVSKATYVYDKDVNSVPKPVAGALNKINAGGKIVADEFEIHTTSGSGQTPAQYAKIKEAALKEGLPCLVVMAGQTVHKIVKAPTTEEQVMEALK
jgi:hypothetical protein